MRPAAFLTLLLVGLVPAFASPVQRASAADVSAPEPLTARTDQGIVVAADLQRTALAGRPVVVEITVANGTASAVSFPDLASRPHLVTFEIVPEGGRRQVRYTTPPAEDPDLRWTLPPGGRRQALLEIPSAAGIPARSFELRVVVKDGAREVALGPTTVTLVTPDPVAAARETDPATFEVAGWMVPWLQGGGAQVPVYVDVIRPEAPERQPETWHLLDLPEAVVPVLAASRPSEAWDRHLYWSTERSLVYARLQARGIRHDIRRVDLPWPRWSLLARGGSAPTGGLHVPIWIPAPRGGGGDVKVVSVDPSGQARFRNVAHLDEEPVATGLVDSAGQYRLILLHDGKLDHYTLSTEPGATLPGVGRRLLPPRPPPPREAPVAAGEAPAPATAPLPPSTIPEVPSPSRVDGVTFGLLGAHGDFQGGLAVFTWALTPAGDRTRVDGTWLALDGRPIRQVEGAELTPGHRIRDVVPSPDGTLWLFTLDRTGAGWVHHPGWPSPLGVGAPGSWDQLRLDEGGRPVLVKVRKGSGVRAERLERPGS